MTMKQTVHAIDYASLGDPELVALAGSGQRGAFRYIMQRRNQRLFRVARGVLNADPEDADAVQEAYVRAFTHLDSFRGEASLSTWLSRIVINEALGRLRTRRRREQAMAPTLGNVDRVKQRAEKTEIADPKTRRFQSCR